MADRIFLSLACIPYMLSSAYAFYAFGAKRFSRTHLNLGLMMTGFALHTFFLYLRAVSIHHCPLTNPFEMIVFLSWAIVLNYLLLGPTMRVSLLGAFSAPLVLVINLIALLIPALDYPTHYASAGWGVEMHAGLSVLAYGTLGIATVAAVMFLVANYYLKMRFLPPILSRLPPVGKLDVVCQRVTVLGFSLLTVGMIVGFATIPTGFHIIKVGFLVLVWIAYCGILIGKFMAKISPVRFAYGCVGIYLFVLITFWGIHLHAVPQHL